MTYVPKLPERNDNVSPDHPLVDLAWLLGATTLILFGLWWALGLTVDYAVERLPADFEQSLALKMEGPPPAREPGPRAAIAQSVLARLDAQSPQSAYRFQLSVADGGMINAFALPGGRIVLMKGLLDAARSENELAMVLAHELGHYAHRDHLRAMGRGLVLSALAAVFLGSDSNVTELLMGSMSLAHARHSRRQETAADLYGLELLQKTYGHVGGAATFFERALKDQAYAIGWLQTHPLSVERAERLRIEAQRRGWREDKVIPLPAP
ncbi:MAG: M48 family metallopeptidase [Nevskiales bacterium]